MSVCFDEKHREQYERESAMYHRIMQDGKLDKNGYLVEPPSDMTDEEKDYYSVTCTIASFQANAKSTSFSQF